MSDSEEEDTYMVAKCNETFLKDVVGEIMRSEKSNGFTEEEWKRLMRCENRVFDSDDESDSNVKQKVSQSQKRQPSPDVEASPSAKRARGEEVSPAPATSGAHLQKLELPVAPPGGVWTPADLERLTVEQLEQVLRGCAGEQQERNLAAVSSSDQLSEPAARLWITHVILPRLSADSAPSAALTSSLAQLTAGFPQAVCDLLLLPLIRSEHLPHGDLLPSLVRQRLDEEHRISLIRSVCSGDPPLSGASLPVLHTLLQATPIDRDVTGRLVSALCASVPALRASLPFSKLLLLLAQTAGTQLTADDVTRLQSAAAQLETPVRRGVQAAYRRLTSEVT